jgi:hypothetical protein
LLRARDTQDDTTGALRRQAGRVQQGRSTHAPAALDGQTSAVGWLAAKKYRFELLQRVTAIGEGHSVVGGRAIQHSGRFGLSHRAKSSNLRDRRLPC